MEMEPAVRNNIEAIFGTVSRKVIYHRKHIHFRRRRERGETDFRKAL